MVDRVKHVNLSGNTLVVRCLMLVFVAAVWTPTVHSSDVFIEAEAFEKHGGWKLDTQFIDTMHSPYLIAHGLGTPVKDATTEIEVETAGRYFMWARTIDWVAKFKASPAPGKFQIHVDGNQVGNTMGTKSETWAWQRVGEVTLSEGTHQLSIRDLTGFDGRLDAIYMTTESNVVPPEPKEVLSKWRRKQLGLPAEERTLGNYDLVVIGGGYSGMGAAISAARMGCKVALIQNRDVLGGNGSSEIRVWAMGLIRRGNYPRIGEIIEEFADQATKSPGTKEEFGDDLKLQIVQAEPNIDLMLGHHVYGVDAQKDEDGSRKITSVRAINTHSGESVRIEGTLFSDCTGHGTIGFLAGADYEMTPKGRMGMSNMWAWAETGQPTTFPKTPWALPLEMKDFPYPRDHHGQWFWESGFDKDPIHGAEAIRDWNLCAVFGAFNAMKNGDGAKDHPDAILTWVAYVGGPRESRRLMGDVVLTADDITSKRQFEDGFVPSTWSIDLHYPKQQYATKFADNPFISKAVHDRSVDRDFGYPVPYRCFYSKNVKNLFMAGRCVSVTHEALGTVRVMKTCGMMGEVVGKAASVAILRDALPRDVYERYLPELIERIKLPGKARRQTVDGDVTIPDDALPLASSHGPMAGLNPQSMKGYVIDETDAKTKGKWTKGGGAKKVFVGYGYRYASANSNATASFEFRSPVNGTMELSIYNYAHENRGTQVPVTIDVGMGEPKQVVINQRESRDDHTVKITTLEDVQKDQTIKVTISAKDSGGTVHLDAIRFLPQTTP